MYAQRKDSKLNDMFVVCHRHEASRENQNQKKRGPACEEGRTNKKNEMQALRTYILLCFQGLEVQVSLVLCNPSFPLLLPSVLVGETSGGRDEGQTAKKD